MLKTCKKRISQIRVANSRYLTFLVGEHQQEILQIRRHYEAQLAERDALLRKYSNALAELFSNQPDI